MRKEVKDLYTAILCARGYVRGLREKLDGNAYKGDIITFAEQQRMNNFVRDNMNVLQMKNKKLLMFDLDGTLAESKSPVSEDMVALLNRITNKYDISIAIISGCNYEQFHSQFPFNQWKSNLGQYHLMPVSGGQMYVYEGYDAGWIQIYNNDLTLRDKAVAYYSFCNAVQTYNLKFDDRIKYPHEEAYGEIAEDRGSQVTFSLLGQDAPLEEKIKFDPDASKRKRLVDMMLMPLNDIDVRIGGTTSIDVTKKGINKAYGVRKIIEHLDIEVKDAVFIGDALFEGGNDHAVKETGIECVETTGPEQTMQILKSEFFGEQNAPVFV